MYKIVAMSVNNIFWYLYKYLEVQNSNKSLLYINVNMYFANSKGANGGDIFKELCDSFAQNTTICNTKY